MGEHVRKLLWHLPWFLRSWFLVIIGAWLLRIVGSWLLGIVDIVGLGSWLLRSWFLVSPGTLVSNPGIRITLFVVWMVLLLPIRLLQSIK